MVQKLWDFKVCFHFLLFVLISEIGGEPFFTGRGLATETERWGRRHGGSHVGQEGHGRLTRGGHATTGTVPW